MGKVLQHWIEKVRVGHPKKPQNQVGASESLLELSVPQRKVGMEMLAWDLATVCCALVVLILHPEPVDCCGTGLKSSHCALWFAKQ
jgi:hypothetical protein